MKYNNPTSKGLYNTVSHSVSKLYQSAKENAFNIGLGAILAASTLMPMQSTYAGRMDEKSNTKASVTLSGDEESVLERSLHEMQATHMNNKASVTLSQVNKLGAYGWGGSATSPGILVGAEQVKDEERPDMSQTNSTDVRNQH